MSGPRPPLPAGRVAAAVPVADDARLTNDDFRALRERVAERCGIDLAADQRSGIERRLRERLVALGLRGESAFRDYVRLLLVDHPDAAGRSEIDEAIELLTTNETYFFREEYQLRAFRDEVIPLLARQAGGRKRLAVWSAGCSTGEEAYTIATLLLESPELTGWELRVFGTDISQRCLVHARRGIYTGASFRATTAEARKRWFIERPDGSLVAERVRSICHFGALNLLENERASSVGRVDAIFCRNVLIYLQAAARRRVIDLFHERLYPGGVLLLGHSESLLNVASSLELLHLRGDLAYRKPTGHAAGYSTPRPFPAVPSSEVASSERRRSSVPAPSSEEARRVPAPLSPRKGVKP